MGINAVIFFKTKEPVSDEKILRLHYELCDILRPVLFVRGPGNDYGSELAIAKAKYNDGFYEVHVGGRYYDKHYERGCFGDYYLIALFLWHKLPGCEVFYQGDCDGEPYYPTSPERMEETLRHWFDNGHRGYNKTDPNQICKRCNEPMYLHGWRRGRPGLWSCACGNKAESPEWRNEN